MTFRFDQKGVEEILKKMPAREINSLARKVADHAGEDAVVHEYTTDRAAASVSVPDYHQAQRGALTRAAATAGLEVHLEM